MIIIILIIIAIAVPAFLLYADYDHSVKENRTRFNVSSEGPIPLKELIEEIKTEDYYHGYDNDTVKWMESLGNKYAFLSSDGFVIMKMADADKIPSVFACDVSFYEIFSAKVIEKHSLGSGDIHRNVYYVKDVKYIKEEAHYYDV